MKNKITVFSLSPSKKLAQDIASILGTKVGDCKVHTSQMVKSYVKLVNLFVVRTYSLFSLLLIQ